jgi:mono/diheme cytochrome c family protein
MLSKLRFTVALAVVVVGSGLTTWVGQPMQAGERPAPAGAPAADNPAVKVEARENLPDLVKRGAYLVNEVARCGDCHTPHDGRGRPDSTRHLQGGEIWFIPKARDREWEGRAPDITASGKAGKWSEDKMIRLLTTGKESDPPMPAYHLTREDARAMTAYLRSLPGKKNAAGVRKRGEERKKDGREKDDERRKKERDRREKDDD